MLFIFHLITISTIYFNPFNQIMNAFKFFFCYIDLAPKNSVTYFSIKGDQTLLSKYKTCLTNVLQLLHLLSKIIQPSHPIEYMSKKVKKPQRYNNLVNQQGVSQTEKYPTHSITTQILNLFHSQVFTAKMLSISKQGKEK